LAVQLLPNSVAADAGVTPKLINAAIAPIVVIANRFLMPSPG
jgi:hypothetical protein